MRGEIVIHELGPKGDGVHRSGRESAYIDRALPGEKVQARIERGSDGVLRGDLLRVVRASPYRVAAPCPNYDLCGGCTIQHAKDEFYRRWKTDIIREALLGRGLKPRVWHPPVFLPAGDRRRGTFNALKKNGTVTLGHYRRRAHQVTDIAACFVVDPALMAMREQLKPLLALILQEGKPAAAFIQLLDGQFDLVVTGAVGRLGRPDAPIREAVAQFARAAKVSRLGWRPTLDDPVQILVETRPVLARFGDLDVPLPPLAFLQPSAAGEAALVRAVMDLLPRGGTFADLFSGCGTFTGPMLARGSVDAFESVAPAIRALDRAKKGRPLRPVCRDLFLDPLRRDEANRYDAIVFDPPRAGAQAQMRMLASSRTPLLVGVSCNPATFARDARILVDGGYRLDSVRVVDQFAWSHHVELVAAFTKRPRQGPR